MRYLSLFCLLIAIVVPLSGAVASLTPVPIEGTILVSSSDATRGYIYFIQGMSDNTTPAPAQFTRGEISPYMDQVVYSIQDTQPANTADVWVANIDGSGETNITGLAALGGVSCNPAWSPDATQIAFQHADPTSELAPCDAGFQVWVINSDGTGAHQVMAGATVPTWNPAWAPSGARLVFATGGAGAVAMNADGTDPVTLPPMDFMDWSPDGTSIAYSSYEEGSDGGELGMWRRLRVASADGTNSRVLFEHFLSDADLATHLALWESSFPAGGDPVDKVYEGIGPSNPKWSPCGNRILFRMAYPFVPDGLIYWDQVELWLYDLDTDESIPITENEVPEWEHSWDGDNTLPTDPEVTVDNTTVTFPEVTDPGVTTIVLESAPPSLPAIDQPIGDCYEINTTAVVSGPAEVSMAYDPATLPTAAEAHLKLLRYDEGAEQWEDTTVSRDLTNKVIYGETETLGLMRLAWPLPESHFSDVSDSPTDPFWALWEIEATYGAGIVQGYGNGTYQPDRLVNRGQMAIYISRAVAGGDSLVLEPATGTQTFPDVDAGNVAYYRYVEYCAAKNIVRGFWDGNYKPDKLVNRGQMAMYIARALVQPGGDTAVPPDTDGATFPDVTDTGDTALCFNHVEYLAGLGVVAGFWDGKYHPEREVRRDQMAAYVTRAFELPM